MSYPCLIVKKWRHILNDSWLLVHVLKQSPYFTPLNISTSHSNHRFCTCACYSYPLYFIVFYFIYCILFYFRLQQLCEKGFSGVRKWIEGSCGILSTTLRCSVEHKWLKKWSVWFLFMGACVIWTWASVWEAFSLWASSSCWAAWASFSLLLRSSPFANSWSLSSVNSSTFLRSSLRQTGDDIRFVCSRLWLWGLTCAGLCWCQFVDHFCVRVWKSPLSEGWWSRCPSFLAREQRPPFSRLCPAPELENLK